MSKKLKWFLSNDTDLSYKFDYDTEFIMFEYYMIMNIL